MSKRQAKSYKDALKGGPAILWVPSLLGLLFVLVTGAHRCQLGNAGYTRSFFIPIEMVLVLILFLLIIIQLIAGIVLLVRRRWNMLLVLVFNLIASTVLTIVGMRIDAPTIIYMTEGRSRYTTSLHLNGTPLSLHVGQWVF